MTIPTFDDHRVKVHRQDDLKKVLAPVKPIPRSPDLQINTDAIFEDGSTDSNPSPPGLCRENQCDLADLKVLGMLPSLGSLEHASGTCKRCNFYPKGRCPELHLLPLVARPAQGQSF